MYWLGRLIKWLLLLLAGLAFSTAVYFAIAFTLPFFPANKNRFIEKPDLTIYVITNGVHTDLVFPIASPWMNWADVFPLENIAGPLVSADLIAIGWGDREFYLNTPTWADLTARRALGALLGFNPSLYHVSLYRRGTLPGNPHVVEISARQYQTLITYVLASVATPVTQVNGSYSGNDGFFEALGSYNLFTTCNTWTGDGLQAAGIPVSHWTPFAGNVLANLQPLQ